MDADMVLGSIGLHPYGVVSLATPTMKSQQEYDVSLTLAMPRSVPNVERGNFMVTLQMLNEKAENLGPYAEQQASQRDGFSSLEVLFRSRRPVLFPYVDPVVSLASRILFLVYHIFVPGSSTNIVVVPLAEKVSFPRDSLVPRSAYLEVEGGQNIQTYHAELQLTAQLRGLRWLMVHYRISTYLAFTLFFWASEVIFMGIAWGMWGLATGSSNGESKGKKGRLEGEWPKELKEEEEETDHPENYPTYGRQPALKYEPKVKDEMDPEQPLSELPRAGADADDEDESFEDEDPQQRDSGIGTSYSEDGKASVRRRSRNRLN